VVLWATIGQVSDWLGIPSDQRMIDALDVSNAWCQGQRPDLDPNTEIPSLPQVQHAVVLFAALLYRERTSPAGFSTYDAIDTQAFTDQSAMLNVYRLLGTRKPVAR
jgi:hypothetical protein